MKALDEHVWRHTRRGDKYVTVIIDLTPVRDGTGPARLLDMVQGRSKKAFKDWLAQREEAWRHGVDVVAMDGFTVIRGGVTQEAYWAASGVRELLFDEPQACPGFQGLTFDGLAVAPNGRHYIAVNIHLPADWASAMRIVRNGLSHGDRSWPSSLLEPAAGLLEVIARALPHAHHRRQRHLYRSTTCVKQGLTGNVVFNDPHPDALLRIRRHPLRFVRLRADLAPADLPFSSTTDRRSWVPASDSGLSPTTAESCRRGHREPVFSRCRA